MKSKIFTKAESKALEDRIKGVKGIKKDKTGIYASRVKPKLLELLEYWFPRKKELSKIVEKVKK